MIKDTFNTAGMKPLIPLAFQRAIDHTPFAIVASRLIPGPHDLSKFGRTSTSKNRWARRNSTGTDDFIIRTTRAMVDEASKFRITVDVIRIMDWKQNVTNFLDRFKLGITLVDMNLILPGVDESIYTNIFWTPELDVPAGMSAEEYFTERLPDEFNAARDSINKWQERRRNLFTVMNQQAPKYI